MKEEENKLSFNKNSVKKKQSRNLAQHNSSAEIPSLGQGPLSLRTQMQSVAVASQMGGASYDPSQIMSSNRSRVQRSDAFKSAMHNYASVLEDFLVL